jgi:hypothetical protein
VSGKGCTPSLTYCFGLLKVQTEGSEYGVRNKSLWDALLGLQDAVVETVEVDTDAGQIIAHVRIMAAADPNYPAEPPTHKSGAPKKALKQTSKQAPGNASQHPHIRQQRLKKPFNHAPSATRPPAGHPPNEP